MNKLTTLLGTTLLALLGDRVKGSSVQLQINLLPPVIRSYHLATTPNPLLSKNNLVTPLTFSTFELLSSAHTWKAQVLPPVPLSTPKALEQAAFIVANFVSLYLLPAALPDTAEGLEVTESYLPVTSQLIERKTELPVPPMVWADSSALAVAAMVGVSIAEGGYREECVCSNNRKSGSLVTLGAAARDQDAEEVKVPLLASFKEILLAKLYEVQKLSLLLSKVKARKNPVEVLLEIEDPLLVEKANSAESIALISIEKMLTRVREEERVEILPLKVAVDKILALQATSTNKLEALVQAATEVENSLKLLDPEVESTLGNTIEEYERELLTLIEVYALAFEKLGNTLTRKESLVESDLLDVLAPENLEVTKELGLAKVKLSKVLLEVSSLKMSIISNIKKFSYPLIKTCSLNLFDKKNEIRIGTLFSEMDDLLKAKLLRALDKLVAYLQEPEIALVDEPQLAALVRQEKSILSIKRRLEIGNKALSDQIELFTYFIEQLEASKIGDLTKRVKRSWKKLYVSNFGTSAAKAGSSRALLEAIQELLAKRLSAQQDQLAALSRISRDNTRGIEAELNELKVAQEEWITASALPISLEEHNSLEALFAFTRGDLTLEELDERSSLASLRLLELKLPFLLNQAIVAIDAQNKAEEAEALLAAEAELAEILASQPELATGDLQAILAKLALIAGIELVEIESTMEIEIKELRSLALAERTRRELKPAKSGFVLFNFNLRSLISSGLSTLPSVSRESRIRAFKEVLMEAKDTVQAAEWTETAAAKEATIIAARVQLAQADAERLKADAFLRASYARMKKIIPSPLAFLIDALELLEDDSLVKPSVSSEVLATATFVELEERTKDALSSKAQSEFTLAVVEVCLALLIADQIPGAQEVLQELEAVSHLESSLTTDTPASKIEPLYLAEEATTTDEEATTTDEEAPKE